MPVGGSQIIQRRWLIYSAALAPWLLTAMAVFFFVCPIGVYDPLHTSSTILGLFVVIGIGEWMRMHRQFQKEKLSDCFAG